MSNAAPATSAPALAHQAYDYAIVDVFAEQPLAGNALAVFTDARGLTTERCSPSPARPTSARPPSSCPARPRSNASAASTSASSPCAKNSSSPAIPRSAPQAGSISTTPSCAAPQPSPSISASAPSRSPSPRSRTASASSAPCARTIPSSARSTSRPQSPQRSASSIADLDPALPIQTVSTGMAFCIVPLRSLEVAARLAIPQPLAQAYLAHTDAKFFHCITRAVRRLRRGLARAHAVLQRRRSRHRLGLRLRHRLSRPSFARRQRPAHRPRTGHRDAPPQPHLRPGNPRRRSSHPNVLVGGRTIPIATGRFFLP